MSTVVISGGTGLVGSALTRMLLSRGYKIVVLTRDARRPGHGVSFVQWDMRTGIEDEQVIAGADHIIHLAGAGVADKRWTEKRKKEILLSRVNSSMLLVNLVQRIPNKISSVISASAIGWYGPDGEDRRPFTEAEPAATDFLGDTCALWEKSIAGVRSAGKRLVILRTGIVLSREGGALPQFSLSLRAGVAAVPGSGRQVISWIHIADLCRMYVHALEQPHVEGVYNAAAPNPVTGNTFMTALAKLKRRHFISFHVPSPLVRLALGEMSEEVLKSTTVDSSRIVGTGFSFMYPQINDALKALHQRP